MYLVTGEYLTYGSVPWWIDTWMGWQSRRKWKQLCLVVPPCISNTDLLNSRPYLHSLLFPVPKCCESHMFRFHETEVFKNLNMMH